MPITTHKLRERANQGEDPDQVQQDVLSIMGTLGSDYRAFTHASLEYNSDFFGPDDFEFKRQLCQALRTHFAPHQNSFWDKAVKL